MKLRLLILLLLPAMLQCHTAMAQPADAVPAISAKADTLLSIARANSVNSGNYKDLLASFFRFAVDNIAGDDKKLELSSSIFAIRLKTNPDLNLDKNYIRNTFSRRANISYALRLDSNYHINRFSFGAKYAIIDKRDFTASRQFVADIKTAANTIENINLQVMEAITGRYGKTDPELADKLVQQVNNFFNDTNVTITDLDPELQQILNSAFGNSALPRGAFRTYLDNLYDSIVKNYAHKPLVIAGADVASYTDKVLFSNVNVYLDGTGGIYQNNNERFNLEVAGRAKMSFLDDSTTASRDMQRSYVSGELGVNCVFRNAAKRPTFELKLAAAGNYFVSGLYLGEEKQVFTMNTTLRLRISKAMWIPLDIKYDPVNNNFIGLLHVTSNFDWLGDVIKQ